MKCHAPSHRKRKNQIRINIFCYENCMTSASVFFSPKCSKHCPVISRVRLSFSTGDSVSCILRVPADQIKRREFSSQSVLDRDGHPCSTLPVGTAAQTSPAPFLARDLSGCSSSVPRPSDLLVWVPWAAHEEGILLWEGGNHLLEGSSWGSGISQQDVHRTWGWGLGEASFEGECWDGACH